MLPMTISISLPSLMTKWLSIQKIYSKLSFALILQWRHHNGIVRNIKKWISQERNMTFLWNKKNELCFKYKISSYLFLEEVAFKKMRNHTKKILKIHRRDYQRKHTNIYTKVNKIKQQIYLLWSIKKIYKYIVAIIIFIYDLLPAPMLFIYHEMNANPKAHLEPCPTSLFF